MELVLSKTSIEAPGLDVPFTVYGDSFVVMIVISGGYIESMDSDTVIASESV